jgi:hypothetical protein
MAKSFAEFEFLIYELGNAAFTCGQMTLAGQVPVGDYSQDIAIKLKESIKELCEENEQLKKQLKEAI